MDVSVLTSRAGGTRTPNRRFWRPVLYQLSYCPLQGCCGWVPLKDSTRQRSRRIRPGTQRPRPSGLVRRG